MNYDEMAELFGEPISTYSRAQAIDDGVLVDLTEWASADKGFIGGFCVPVAVTASVWADIQSIPDSVSYQDVRGRAHDLLWMASLAARRATGGAPMLFTVILPTRSTRKRNRQYQIAIGPGDAGEPVVTIMQPHED